MNGLSRDDIKRCVNAVVLTLSLAIVYGAVHTKEAKVDARQDSTIPLMLAEEVKIHCPKRSRIHLAC